MSDIGDISECEFIILYALKIIIRNYIIGLQKTSNKYSEKQASKHRSENDLMKLAWDVQELSCINDRGRKLRVECAVLTEKLNQPDFDKLRIEDNFSLKLEDFKIKVTTFLKKCQIQKESSYACTCANVES